MNSHKQIIYYLTLLKNTSAYARHGENPGQPYKEKQVFKYAYMKIVLIT